ncbi:hypothetical protein GCM10023147_37390 [Tsukamurella soli]|uniref:Uncharacterized protein n=1 Tax=Tsukamurella soli TaxID=644556 RepID=A0ABP8K3E2_9ACTN
MDLDDLFGDDGLTGPLIEVGVLRELSDVDPFGDPLDGGIRFSHTICGLLEWDDTSSQYDYGSTDTVTGTLYCRTNEDVLASDHLDVPGEPGVFRVQGRPQRWRAGVVVKFKAAGKAP